MSKNFSDKPTVIPPNRLLLPDDPIFKRPFGIYTRVPRRPKPTSPSDTTGETQTEKPSSPKD